MPIKNRIIDDKLPELSVVEGRPSVAKSSLSVAEVNRRTKVFNTKSLVKLCNAGFFE
jgi:hypothetical protein